MIRIRFILITFFILNLNCFAKQNTQSIAIVIDSPTYIQVVNELNNYRSAIKNIDKKDTYLILIDTNTTPDTIRDTLKSLYLKNTLEGAVLIGNIPIPMIRGANHLSTAFKMTPSAPWKSSSIPSDRFYDDFGLQFRFLKADKKDNLFYYELSPTGDQFILCDIYTARIKPSKADKSHTFSQLISIFLSKATEAKNTKNYINNIFHFGGHGNSSESFNARIDENRAYYEQFELNKRKGKVQYLNFDEDNYIKRRLTKVLANKSMDLAHLHTHGAVKSQYISKEPYIVMPREHIEYLKRFIRNRIKSAKNPIETKEEIIKTYNVPESWTEGYNNKITMQKDSIIWAKTDISIEELEGYASGVKVLILDACFNGAFIHDDYIASRYAFNKQSSTIAVMANSVNIIQDHWKNELAGLLNYGVCIGNWAKYTMTLESHIFGDPTYSFKKQTCDIKNIDKIISRPSLKSIIKMSRSVQTDIANFGIKEMARLKLLKDNDLLNILNNDERINTRMEAFMCIIRKSKNIETVIKAISIGLNDSYELLRRMASRYAEICGAPQLEEIIKKERDSPLTTSRVRYHLSTALRAYEFDSLSFNSMNAKEKEQFVSMQRNVCYPRAINLLFNTLKDEFSSQKLRLMCAEALGWYVLSYKREEIHQNAVELLKDLKDKNKDLEIRKELFKTIRRLEDNSNLQKNTSLRNFADLLN